MATSHKPESQLSPPALGSRGIERVVSALESGWWAPGPRVKKLEARLANMLGVPAENVIATNSATSALYLARNVVSQVTCGAPKFCPLTWPSTYLGYYKSPKWVDLDDEYRPEEHLTVGVDLWGGINARSCTVLDAAHNFNGEFHKNLMKKEYSLTRAIVYSFAPQKEVPSFSGGALILSNGTREDIIAHIREEAWMGTRGRVFAGSFKAGKMLMDDVSAALVLEGISKHKVRKAARLRLLVEYEKHLGDSLITKASTHSGHLCVVRAESLEQRNRWIGALNRKGNDIAWSIHYAMNQQQIKACPNAAKISDTILTLPLHIGMNLASVRRVCRALLVP